MSPSENEVRTITLAQWEEQKKQMQALKERRREEWLRHQTVRTQEVTISDTFADRIKYHVPEGEFQTLSDLFRQMIADVEAGSFDEAKYSGLLGN